MTHCFVIVEPRLEDPCRQLSDLVIHRSQHPHVTSEISGHEVVKDELRQQFENLDCDMSDDVNKEELKKAMMSVNLGKFGWDLHGDRGLVQAIDVQFEEMDCSRDGLISWAEFFSVCQRRLNVKDETLSDLQAQIQTVDVEFVVAVVLEDAFFSEYLYPTGLPQRPAPTDSDPYATELDMESLDRLAIVNKCLDSRLPAESLRSLVVRSRTKEEQKLMGMDAEQLQAVAAKCLVDQVIIDGAHHEKAALIDEIDRQNREIPFEVFKAIWMSQMHGKIATKEESVAEALFHSNPLASTSAESDAEDDISVSPADDLD